MHKHEFYKCRFRSKTICLINTPLTFRIIKTYLYWHIFVKKNSIPSFAPFAMQPAVEEKNWCLHRPFLSSLKATSPPLKYDTDSTSQEWSFVPASQALHTCSVQNDKG